MSKSLKVALENSWRADRRISFYDFSGLTDSVTFTEFGLGVNSFAERLQALGVGPGRVVAVMGPTSLALTQACAAVWSAEATLTVLPTPTRLANLELFLSETVEKLKRSQAGLLIGEEDAIAIFRELAGIPVLSFEDLLADAQEVAVKEAQLDGHRPALVQFSSGTTRDPQPILLSEQALLFNSKAVLDCFPGGASQHSCVSWLPLYHDMGLIGCFLMPLLAPGDLTLMGPEVFAVRPLTWLEAISQQRATTSSAPNFALAHCVERISEAEMETLDLSSWKIAMVGAETVRPQTLRKFAEKFAPVGFDAKAFSPVYGLAEATLAVTFSPLGEGLHTLSYDARELAGSGRVQEGDKETASLGRPLQGLSLQIRSEGEVLGEGRLGEVWVKSPALMSGILGEPERKLVDGWLETGDAGFLHQGELYLYGRRRDILLLDGRNHDPGTLEEVVESMSDLRRCCAFTRETEDSKDRLVLICEVANRFDGDLETLADGVRNICRRKASLMPDEVKLVKAGELPVTSSGKLRRGVAAAMYQSGEFEALLAASL